jgi:DNA-binding SARP family transcriptional activator/tetratricopeptide (TPR) repeat protein
MRGTIEPELDRAIPDFRVLGRLEVVANGRDLTPARPKQRALLALLLVRADEVVASDELMEALWGEAPPATAQTALHGHVSALRKLLGPEAIETCPPGYRLRVAAEQIDAGRFRALVEEARREPDPARRAELLGAALSLFRGDPLTDFRYDSFAHDEIRRLEELRLVALEERIEAELALGRHAQVAPELERLVAAHPLREGLRGQLMLALYRAGRQAESLHVYQEGRKELSVELGLEPAPVLQQLERQILAQDPALDPPDPESRPDRRPREERKLVTVLSCDLAGYSPRTEQLDPEDVRVLQRSHLERVRGEIERFGGRLDKIVGDVLLAVFGAPAGHEDDPERAVRAALAIRDRLGEELELRIAVNTGEALVTLDADPQAGEGIVVGDVVNTAPRLLQRAPAGGVIVGEQTHRSSEHAIAYRELEPVTARGKREPLRVWEAIRARPRPERRRPGAELVGRERELAQLADGLARARAERARQLVTIVGVPGIGKTRLVHELYTLVEAGPGDVGWLQGHSLPYGDGVTFWALGEIVKAHAGVLESDTPLAVEEKLRLAVAQALGEDEETEWALGHLRRLVGLAADVPMASDRRDEAFAAWRLFFEALADELPLVLAIEDLHWADEGLLDFVDELAGGMTEVPLLVVVTSRPELLERRPGWGGGKRNAVTVSLAPLSDDDTERLLVELLDREASPELVRRVHGNPLYAEEYARLVLERGPGHLARPPESLHALIAARLDALPLEEKALVQDAAVVGEVAWAGAVAAVGGRERPAVEELARPLARKDFLRRRRRSSVEGETEYAFHHALVRDVAYAQIPRAARADKHRLAAEWIESLGRRDDHVELLAHHYVQALELARAAGGAAANLERLARLSLRDAGDRAASLGALPAATRFYRQALELWPEEDPDRARLLLRLGRALLFSEVGGEQELLLAADSLVATGDRPGEAVALLLTLYHNEGRGQLAREHLDRALDLVADLPPSREKAEVLSEVCRSRMMMEENDEALQVAREALAVCEELGLEDTKAAVLISAGPARFDADPEAAFADLERGIAIAQRVNSHDAARGYGNLAHLLLSVGDLAGAYRAWRSGSEIGERFGLRWYTHWFRTERLAETYYTGGDWDELLELAAEYARERTIMAGRAHDLSSRVRLARGDVAGAVAETERMLEFARETQEPQVIWPALVIAAFARLTAGERAGSSILVDELMEREAWNHVMLNLHAAPLLGSVLSALARGDELARRAAGLNRQTPWLEGAVASATGDFARAADVYERIGDRPDEAYARLEAAEQLIAEGRGAEADAQLVRALAFFRSVGATRYVEAGERLLAAST